MAGNPFQRAKYIDEGLSIKQIAELCESSKAAVLHDLLRFGIPIRKHGQPHGRPSQPRYGKRLVRGSERDYQVEQKVIEAIQDLRIQRMTLREVGKTLTRLGIPTKCKGRGWHPEMVRRVLFATVRTGWNPAPHASTASPAAAVSVLSTNNALTGWTPAPEK